MHLLARKFTTNAGGELSGANCVEKMALRAIPALTDRERQWAVFKTHPLVPPGACNINVVQMEGGANAFILADRCDAYVTVTYLPNERCEDIVQEVEEHVARATALDDWVRRHPPRLEWGPPEHPIEFAPRRHRRRCATGSGAHGSHPGCLRPRAAGRRSRRYHRCGVVCARGHPCGGLRPW